MHNSSELIVYKASAGSGKTFTLAVEYIKLLIQNPHAYRNILAVTFTNKATTEMKERILSQLYGIASGSSESDAYLKQLMKAASLSEQEVRERAEASLSLLIHDYSYFRVETIDSFFLSVMRNLSRELGIGTNLDISLNNMEVLDKAVDQFIEKLNPSSQALRWVMDFIKERIADNQKWNITNELKKFGKNIFDEGYLEKGDALRPKLRNPSYIDEYGKTIENLQEHAEEELNGLKELADKFFDTLEQHGIAPEELNNKSRGIMSYFKKLKNDNFDDKIVTTNVEKCLYDANEWAGKSAPNRELIIQLATDELLPLLKRCEKIRQTNNRIITSCHISLGYLHQLRLLTSIDDEVRLLNNKENRFLLSDTNNLLSRLMQAGDASFIFEKIGSNIRHVMIDEFQDTSRMQWNNFKFLLLEGLSLGTGSLVVGDVKQSIYRWRNGDWSILNNLKDHLGPYPIREEKLTVNRRSESNIIRFNNQFFKEACKHVQLNIEKDINESSQMLASAYNELEQQSPKNDEKGYVKIQFINGNDQKNSTEMTLEELGKCVDKLVKQGVQLTDIAILIRVNKHVPVIADYFTQHYPAYQIVSSEAFRLDASVAVCMLMAALRYLSDAHDTIAKAQLAASYQREVCHKEIEWNDLLLQDTDTFLPNAFLENQEALKLMPLYELMEKLVHLFRLKEVANQDAYLFYFFDMLLDYLRKQPADLGSFIAYWDETLCGKTLPAGELDGIRIYSIHRAKGLEFHTVLVPFCNWELSLSHTIWCTPEEAPYNELDLLPVDYKMELKKSIYQKDYCNEYIQLLIDNLNMLYVAFTRASKNLIVLPHHKGRKNFIYDTIHKSVEAILNETKKDEYTLGEVCLSEPKSVSVTTNRLLMQAEKREVKMESFTNKLEFRQSNRSADFIQGDEKEKQGEYIQQGRLLHRIFSEIHTLDDVDGMLQRMQFEGVVESIRSVDSLKKMVKKAVSHPLATDWFSGKWRLYNECTIIRNVEGELQARRPDRVMMQGDKVVVVDFKFGKKKEVYTAQVLEYMHLLQQMGYKQVSGWLWYVYKNEFEEIKER